MVDPSIAALSNRASALRRAGRTEEAIAAYTQLLALQPDLAESWYNLGWLQRQARRFEEALASYQQALDRSVSTPEEVHLNRAVILFAFSATSQAMPRISTRSSHPVNIAGCPLHHVG